MTYRVNQNGDFSVWQMGLSHSPMIHTYMLADWWRGQNSSNAVLAVEKSAHVPTYAQAGRVIGQSMKVTVTTASTGASQNVALVYRGDGYEFRKLYQRAAKLRFWVDSSVTGTFFAGISSGQASGGAGYSCPCSYAITNSGYNAYELNIPASPADGFWLDDQVGYSLYFFLSLGSSFYGTANVWNANNAGGTSAQTNFVANQGATFYLADVRISPADEADPEPCDYRREVWSARTRLRKSFMLDQAPAGSLGFGQGEIYVPASRDAGVDGGMTFCKIEHEPMARVPDVTIYNVQNQTAQMRNVYPLVADCTGTAVDNRTPSGFRVYATAPAGTKRGDSMAFHYVEDATLPVAA